jgi:uncharacterized membrane protein YfcA
LSVAGAAAACAVVAVGSLLQGAVGFGLSLIAAPLVTLIDPTLVPGPLLVAALVLPVLTGRRDRSWIDLHGVRWALVGRVPGSVLGATLLAGLSPRAVSLAIGLVVLAGVLMTVSGVRLRPRAPTLLAAGVLSGFMGTTAAIGGPPIALVYQHAEGPRLRGTLAGYFVLAAAISIGVLAAAGRFGVRDVVAGLALLPGVGLGYLASRRAVRWIDRGLTRHAVLLVSALAAVVLVVRALL